MTKIATKGYCNIVETGGIYSGSFLGDLISECPTYQDIIGTDKFNVNGSYEDNQLVKESDISKYSGKTKNYANVWGEWDLTGSNFNMAKECVWLKFHITFLYNPDVNTTFKINYRVNYVDNNDDTTLLSQNDSITISITNPTYFGGIYGGSVSTSTLFGIKNNSILYSVTITSVVATPATTSIYDYTTFIKPVTQNFFKSLSLSSANFSTKNYIDNTTDKTEQCSNKISVGFEYPSGITTDNVWVNIEPERNFNGIGQSDGIYQTDGYFSYEFTTPDNYGRRGYKLPYYTAKFKIMDNSTHFFLYLYPIWNPREYNTGIELTSLINETESLSEE